MSDLPKGWQHAKLGDILSLKNGYAFKSAHYQDTGIPVIRISDIQEGKVTTQKSVCVDLDNISDNFIINEGDILIAMSGATTGKIGVFSENTKVYQNQRVGNLIPHSESVSRNFIQYLLAVSKKDIEDRAYGGAQPNISSKLIEGIDIPLPPLAEQKRIVAKLDSLFEELDTAKERLAVNH